MRTPKSTSIPTAIMTIMLVSIPYASAHLLASKAKCTELYGKPVKTLGNQIAYRTTTGVVVTAEFLEGQVSSIFYTARKFTPAMQDAIRLLNQVSAKKVKWTQVAAQNGMVQTDTNYFDDRSPKKGQFMLVSEVKQIREKSTVFLYAINKKDK